MKRLIAALLLACMPPAIATAQWPTTEYVPFPNMPTSDDIEEFISDGFPGFATGAETFFNITGATMVVETLNLTALMGVAAAPLQAVLGVVSNDSKALETAGFPAPIIEPMITVNSTGKKYYALWWTPFRLQNGQPDRVTPMRHGCYGFGINDAIARIALQVNNNFWPFAQILAGWNSRFSWGRPWSQSKLRSTFVHEIVHGIQKSSWVEDDPCDNDYNAVKWMAEGTANGIAHYLLTRNNEAALVNWNFPRDVRPYDQSLHVGGSTTLDYGTGSFFRYLLEGYESATENGLSVMAAYFGNLDKETAQDSLSAIRVLDDTLKEGWAGWAGEHPRGLYHVFPEFLTEYGSYGGSRYTHNRPDPNGIPTRYSPRSWLEKNFGACKDFVILPNVTQRKPITIPPLAGKCIRVNWGNFATPVSLQFYATGDPDFAHGDIHIGEAYRQEGNNAAIPCWDVTQKIGGPRLTETSDKKCILKRGTPKIDTENAGLWTAAKPIQDSGDGYYIVTNIASEPEKSRPLKIELWIGALGIEMAANQIVPRKPGVAPVEHGLANLDARVHMVSGNSDRMLFEGRVIDGPGPDFDLPSGTVDDGTTGQGVLSFARGGNYWIGFLGTGPAQPNYRNGAMIIKNPVGFEQNFQTPGGLGPEAMLAAMNASAISGGMIGEIPGVRECGYDIVPEIVVEELSEKTLRYRIEGDLFNFGRMMNPAGFIGAGSVCGVMAALHEERTSVTVSVPFGRLYDGSSRIEEASPPGQASHLANFQPGPSFGDIESSRTLIENGPWAGGGGNQSAPGGSGGGGGGGNAESSELGNCSCGCPQIARPETQECRLQCSAVWARCEPGGNATASSPLDTLRRSSDFQNLNPVEQRTIIEDFQRMSPQTQARIIGGSAGN